MRSEKKNMERIMATESTEEHGNIKNFLRRVRRAHRGQLGITAETQRTQRNQLIQKTLQSHLKSSMPFSALSPIHTPRTHQISHFSLLTFYVLLFYFLEFIFPCISVCFRGHHRFLIFYFSVDSVDSVAITVFYFLLLTSYFLLFTFSMPLKAPASSPNNEYQYHPAGKHGP